MRRPVVTVGVPVWNGERYLAEALTALRDQDLADVQVVVSDNGSTDDTLEIARSFAATDDRFTVLHSDTNRGVTWNFNRVLAAAQAPLFMWNAADDVVRPGHLAQCRAALDRHPEATIAFSRVVLIGADGERLGERDDVDLDFLGVGPPERLHRFFVRQAYQVIGYGGVIRTEVLRSMGGHPDFYGGDMALAVRMALRAPWVQVPEQLYWARNHEEQTNKLQAADPVRQTRAYRSHRREIAFPQWYLNHRLLTEAATAPLGVRDRARAVRVVLRDWTVENWRFFPYDVKRNVQRVARGAGRRA
ncbi:glycosyltransferase [Isoptericola halotolerans]|uniref:Glycosyltransferase involved in cell wall biosynthesis n=1 Tax=Isoptericola halotolerans TaxID=300560 RepID=A0ABX2A3L0_9MICO|nr:glycosyltransferase involved in cell wall biosynthesis [Isoptericola halotolerans]